MSEGLIEEGIAPLTRGSRLVERISWPAAHNELRRLVSRARGRDHLAEPPQAGGPRLPLPRLASPCFAPPAPAVGIYRLLLKRLGAYPELRAAPAMGLSR